MTSGYDLFLTVVGLHIVKILRQWVCLKTMGVSDHGLMCNDTCTPYFPAVTSSSLIIQGGTDPTGSGLCLISVECIDDLPACWLAQSHFILVSFTLCWSCELDHFFFIILG